MTNLPSFFERADGDRRILSVSGDWTVQTVANVDKGLRQVDAGQGGLVLDVTDLGAIDTAGAFVLDRTLRENPCEIGGVLDLIGEHPSAEALIQQVRRVSEGCERPRQPSGFVNLFERTGRGFTKLWTDSVATFAFLGETVSTCLRLLAQPHKIRWTPTVAIMEEAGLDALPIIAFLSFFVGMVVAFIGATVLGDFGAEIFTVELVGFAMLREFGAVISAIILAGRTNSAFTAQIGAMKMRQEVDAMTTLGLRVQEVLVAPRVFAMVIMTPILAFVGTLAGVGGGIFVGWAVLDIPVATFLGRLQDFVPAQNFWVGMSKAPVFGFVLAVLACRQGLLVGGSVQSLGSHTTTSVVQAIFSVIVIDAIFAIFYMEMGI
ncbi:MAG: ABC transporter permease [Pseudomonadota bacterium]